MRGKIASPQTIMGSMLNFIRYITNVGVFIYFLHRQNYVMINIIYKKLFMLLCEILIKFLRYVVADYSVDTHSTRNKREIIYKS